MSRETYIMAGVALAGAGAMYLWIRKPAVSVDFQGQAPADDLARPGTGRPRVFQPFIDGIASGAGKTFEQAIQRAL